MNLLILGKGKTGTLVAEIAQERGHRVRAVSSAENVAGEALTREALHGIDAVIDFTTPQVVLDNIAHCVRAGTAMVVGTTGWYDRIPQVRQFVTESNTGFVFGANFSIGVNVFFEVARAVAPALNLGYTGHIVERHHAQKKDKPSGTAVAINNALESNSGKKLDIESIREGNVVGDHEIRIESPNDVITLSHSARSRRGFAEGAVRAAEWLRGRTGFYDFKDVWRELK
ncbi:MAG TPA: dihydrodipicolinate reductase C-terminal domain-containing protein [Terriglobales bacterium]|nr:dihydrodipicolinate reductase C-terminal domain-containing protein [Terriglobales bacterium]